MTSAAHEPARPAAGLTRRLRWRPGDLLFQGVTLAASLAAVALVVLLAYKVVRQAWPAMSHFGLGFLTSTAWDPIKNHFGAATFIFGTAVSSLVALALAAPIAIAIALFLTELAPRGIRGAIGTLVELLAAVPSVVLGLWGILVLGPVLKDHVEPWLKSALGFVPLFGGTPSLVGLLPAIVILTIMIVPIVASICRELFSRVPRDLQEGSLALGATRWETVRGVVFPYAAPGIVAALLLGLGRAVGEAIAVTQVIGGGTGIRWSLFGSADTLASRIANQYQGATTGLQVNSILYLAAILLVLSLATNLAAQLVIARFESSRSAAR